MASCRILVEPEVRVQLDNAPPRLQGLLHGIVAFLRVDPTALSVAFPVIAGPRHYTVVFADGRAFLDYEVFGEYHTVVLLDLVWLG